MCYTRENLFVKQIRNTISNSLSLFAILAQLTQISRLYFHQDREVTIIMMQRQQRYRHALHSWEPTSYTLLPSLLSIFITLIPDGTPAEASFSLIAARDKHRGATNKHGLLIPACSYSTYSSIIFSFYLSSYFRC